MDGDDGAGGGGTPGCSVWCWFSTRVLPPSDNLFHIIRISKHRSILPYFVDQDGSGDSDFFFIIFFGDFFEEFVHLGSAGVFGFVRNVVWVVFGCKGSGAWRVDTHVDHIEFSIFHEFEAFCEVFVGLSWEADDHVGGDRDVSLQIFYIIDEGVAVLGRISAEHFFENGSRA